MESFVFFEDLPLTQVKTWHDGTRSELIVTVLSAVDLEPRVGGQYRSKYSTHNLLQKSSIFTHIIKKPSFKGRIAKITLHDQYWDRLDSSHSFGNASVL